MNVVGGTGVNMDSEYLIRAERQKNNGFLWVTAGDSLEFLPFWMIRGNFFLIIPYNNNAKLHTTPSPHAL